MASVGGKGNGHEREMCNSTCFKDMDSEILMKYILILMKFQLYFYLELLHCSPWDQRELWFLLKQMTTFSQQSTVLVLSGETKAVETIRLYPLIFLCSLYTRSLFLCYKTRIVNLVHCCMGQQSYVLQVKLRPKKGVVECIQRVANYYIRYE